VKLTGQENHITPPRIKENEAFNKKYSDLISVILDFYEDMVSQGVPAEDARYILPSGFCTSMMVTMNARELLHFFSIRCCKKAQWEIRRLAYLMLRAVTKVAPVIFAHAGPACLAGECPQADARCFDRMSKLRK
jgi:thymidylate synthase (FAD)